MRKLILAFLLFPLYKAQAVIVPSPFTVKGSSVLVVTSDANGNVVLKGSATVTALSVGASGIKYNDGTIQTTGNIGTTSGNNNWSGTNNFYGPVNFNHQVTLSSPTVNLTGGVWNEEGTVLPATLNTDSSSLVDDYVLAPESGALLIPNSSVFKMYFTSGWGTSANINTNYAESADGITWTRYASSILSGEGRPFVLHNGTTYYLYTQNFAASPSNIDVSTSANGRDFTLWHSNIISTATIGSLASQGLTNTGGVLSGSTLYLFFDEENGGGTFNVGLATSTDFFTFTIFSTNPVISPSPGGVAGAPPNPVKENGKWYAWIWAQLTSGQVPTDIYRYSAPAVTGPWTNSETGIDLPRTTNDEGPNLTNGQLANPSVFEYNNQTYLYYSATKDGTVNTGNSHIKLAIANLPLASLVLTAGGVNQRSLANGEQFPNSVYARYAGVHDVGSNVPISTMVFTTEQEDNFSAYQTGGASSGTYTCPAAGIYQASVTTYYGSATSSSYVTLNKNGAIIDRLFDGTSAGMQNGSATFTCAVNDKISVVNNGAAIPDGGNAGVASLYQLSINKISNQ